MYKPFDATLNRLIDACPEDWANHFGQQLGIPPGPCESLDTDLATTIQADRIFRINGAFPAILHIELEGNGRLGIPKELARYNTVAAHPHDIPVMTLLVLLRRSALASDMTGKYTRRDPLDRMISEFNYHVEKVWERPLGHWLNGGPGLAPLALLTDEAAGGLDAAVGLLRESLHCRGVDEKLTTEVFGSSFILGGLRYEQERLLDAFGRFSMLLEESTTYQYLINKGMDQGRNEGLQALRKIVLNGGTRRFGVPPTEKVASLQKIEDINRLALLVDRISEARSWDDLIADYSGNN